MKRIAEAIGWALAGIAAAALGFFAWERARRIRAKARREIAWSEMEAARLSEVRADKLRKADADNAQVELLGKRADALHSHAEELRRAVMTADDAQLADIMRKSGILAVFLTLALSPGAYAQELPRDCAPEAVEHRGEPLELHGLRGWWFRGEVTRCLVAGYAQMRLLKEELSLTRQQLTLRSNQIELLRAAVEASVQADIESRRALAEARAALEEEDGWSPFLVSGLSFAIGVAATVAVAFAIGGI